MLVLLPALLSAEGLNKGGQGLSWLAAPASVVLLMVP